MAEAEIRALNADSLTPSPNKHATSSPIVEQPAKRRRLSSEKDDRPKPPVLIRPAPIQANAFYGGGSSPQTPEGPLIPVTRLRQKSITGTRRASSLNLRNYPTSPHPAGLAIWLLQKVDQMQKDRVESLSPPFSGSSS